VSICLWSRLTKRWRLQQAGRVAPSRGVFFIPCLKVAGDASRVDLYMEGLLDAPGQFRRTRGGISPSLRSEEGGELRGELVRSSRSRALGQETRQAVTIEGARCLVEDRAGQAEGAGDVGNRLGLGACAAEHLVLDLDQVSCVEEVGMGTEVGVLDAIGMRVQRVVLAQALRLGVVG